MKIDLDELRAQYPWLGQKDRVDTTTLERVGVLGAIPSLRELDVLQMIADGHTNREIAERLVISVETAKSHVRNLLDKMNARSRAHAAALGIRQGLIS